MAINLSISYCEDVEKPSPGDDETLTKIRAAAANPMDYHLMSGAYTIRPMTGLPQTKADPSTLIDYLERNDVDPERKNIG
jgi:NADPH:quinone reductase-like Zn-dependent oxidoreductase